ncbi:MAG: histidine kinase dimerization/phosphoacceptor domain -containing protein [Termitinemataceae bacterium]
MNWRILTLLFATEVTTEIEKFKELVTLKKLPYSVIVPKDLTEADEMLSTQNIDIIVTDLHFASGAFADWLSLWPHPFILLTYYGEEERAFELLHDEVSNFISRDSQYRHLGALSVMIEKVLNVRESIQRQNAHLQLSEKRYMNLVNSIPDIVYSLDAAGRFVYVNEAVSQLGYAPAELIGKHFSTLLHPEDVPRVSRSVVLQEFAGKRTGIEGAPRLFDERRSGKRMTKNLVVRLKPKSPSPYFETSAVVYAYGEVASVGLPVPEFQGGDVGTVGIIRDVTHHQQRAESLEKELELKETLLRETYHRIKNNLQIVSSLLNLHAGELQEGQSKDMFYTAMNQIQSIALLYEQLYTTDSFDKIESRSFVRDLVDLIFQNHEVSQENISAEIVCDQVYLPYQQAMPLALIIVEVLSQSLKFAPLRSKGFIAIRLQTGNENLIDFEIKDEMKGLPSSECFELSDFSKTVVEALCQQLKGTCTWNIDGGSHFSLRIPLFFDK